MNIIRSGIVDSNTDIFWSDISTVAGNIVERSVLVLVTIYNPGSTEQAQLAKMLGAAGLVPEQYNILQLAAGQQLAWHQLREVANPKAIFLVGVLPAQLGISSLFQLNVPNRFNDRMWLPTLSLADLEAQPDFKKQLWTGGMKPLFVDKVYGDLFA